MIYCYNKNAVGDVLLVVVADSQNQEVGFESKETVTRIFRVDTGETVGWNIFDAATLLPDLKGNGQVRLTETELTIANQKLEEVGFSKSLSIDPAPKFVVGFVKSCKKHPDSDHLSITKTEVDNGEVLQIVCGAPNIKAGLKVVVAKVGGMMPDGMMIWPGELRGEESHGMICSAKELRLPNAPTKRGILELPFDAEVGSEFVLPIEAE